MSPETLLWACDKNDSLTIQQIVDQAVVVWIGRILRTWGGKALRRLYNSNVKIGLEEYLNVRCNETTNEMK